MKLATLCYVRRDGQTLMIHRNKRPDDMHLGKWNGLGGKLDPGETPEECARREIFEESGLRIEDLILKGVITFPGFAYDEDWYTFLFTANASQGAVIDPEEGQLAWIDNDQLAHLNLWAGDPIFLEWLDQPGFFSAKFVYKNGEFIDYEAVFYS